MCYIRRTIVIAAALAFALIAASGVWAQDQQKGMIVMGAGTVKAKPDIAYISLGVITQDRDAARAAQSNAKTTNAVIDAIVKFDVPKSDIETTQYSVSPIMDYNTSPPTNKGYSVSNQVRVTLRDLAKIGSLIDVGTKAGANNVEGVTVAIENNDKLHAEALAQAVTKAKAEAQVIATALGVKLGKPISVTEQGGGYPRPMMDLAMAKGAESAPTPYIPGELNVTANVTVVFGME